MATVHGLPADVNSDWGLETNTAKITLSCPVAQRGSLKWQNGTQNIMESVIDWQKWFGPWSILMDALQM